MKRDRNAEAEAHVEQEGSVHQRVYDKPHVFDRTLSTQDSGTKKGPLFVIILWRRTVTQEVERQVFLRIITGVHVLGVQVLSVSAVF